MITHYEPCTFEKILEYDSMRSNYGIGQHNSPMDYGFKDAKEISINSLYDHKRLSSWYVPSSNSTKCIVVEFDSVDHVKIYQDPRYKAKYTDLVSEFIRN